VLGRKGNEAGREGAKHKADTTLRGSDAPYIDEPDEQEERSSAEPGRKGAAKENIVQPNTNRHRAGTSVQGLSGVREAAKKRRQNGHGFASHVSVDLLRETSMP